MTNWRINSAKTALRKFNDLSKKNYLLRERIQDCKCRLLEVGLFNGLGLAHEVEQLTLAVNRIFAISKSINEIIQQDFGKKLNIPKNEVGLFKKVQAKAKEVNSLIQSNIDRTNYIKEQLKNRSIVVWLVNAATNITAVLGKSMIKTFVFIIKVPAQILLTSRSRKKIGKFLESSNSQRKFNQKNKKKWHE